MNTKAWDYKVWAGWHNKKYKNTLSAEDIKGKKFYVESLFKLEETPRGKAVAQVNKFKNMYKAEKNGQLYLVEEEDVAKFPIIPFQCEEVYLKKSDTTVYNYITHCRTAKIKPLQTVGFREFVQLWNPVAHTDEKTRIFLNILAIAAQHGSTHLFVCGGTGSMKSANFTLSKKIFNNVSRISSNITRARLETNLHFNRLINIDELSSIKPQQLREIEPTLQVVTDSSDEYEKGALAQNKALSKTDISSKSIIFTLNRVEDVKQYNKNKLFIEEMWSNPAAIQRRFAKLLLPGKVTSKRVALTPAQVHELLEENETVMNDIAGHAHYFAVNLHKHTHNWEEQVPLLFTDNQQRINMHSQLLGVDAFCNTQEEYNEWCRWINNGIKGYDEMIASLIDVNQKITTNPWAREKENVEEGKEQTDLLVEEEFI